MKKFMILLKHSYDLMLTIKLQNQINELSLHNHDYDYYL